MGDPIDDAFDWLLLIMSTINGILIGLPETIEAKKGVAGALMPPFFVLIVVWLLGHLIKRKHLKAVLKTYAWFYAFFMLFNRVTDKESSYFSFQIKDSIYLDIEP